LRLRLPGKCKLDIASRLPSCNVLKDWNINVGD